MELFTATETMGGGGLRINKYFYEWEKLNKENSMNIIFVHFCIYLLWKLEK